MMKNKKKNLEGKSRAELALAAARTAQEILLCGDRVRLQPGVSASIDCDGTIEQVFSDFRAYSVRFDDGSGMMCRESELVVLRRRRRNRMRSPTNPKGDP